MSDAPESRDRDDALETREQEALREKVAELTRQVQELLRTTTRQAAELAEIQRARLAEEVVMASFSRLKDAPAPEGRPTTVGQIDNNKHFTAGLSMTAGESSEPCLLVRGGRWTFGYVDDDNEIQSVDAEIEDDKEFTDCTEDSPYLHVAITLDEPSTSGRFDLPSPTTSAHLDFWANDEPQMPNGNLLALEGYRAVYCLGKVVYDSGTRTHFEPYHEGGDLYTVEAGGGDQVCDGYPVGFDAEAVGQAATDIARTSGAAITGEHDGSVTFLCPPFAIDQSNTTGPNGEAQMLLYCGQRTVIVDDGCVTIGPASDVLVCDLCACCGDSGDDDYGGDGDGDDDDGDDPVLYEECSDGLSVAPGGGDVPPQPGCVMGLANWAECSTGLSVGWGI